MKPRNPNYGEPEEQELDWNAAATESAANMAAFLKLGVGTTRIELSGPPTRRYNDRYNRPEHVYRVTVLGMPGNAPVPEGIQTLTVDANGPLAAQIAVAGKAGATVLDVVRAGTGQTDTRYSVQRVK